MKQNQLSYRIKPEIKLNVFSKGFNALKAADQHELIGVRLLEQIVKFT
jgi:hypothetical protein